MNLPILAAPRRVAEDTDILTTHLALPGMGVVPVNAFLIHASEPVLVDTGIPALAESFIAALESRIDLEALRWIWLTHADADHTGALGAVLARAPHARVVTTFLGMGKLGMTLGPLPPERFWLLRPGQRLSVGDRELCAIRPPVFDAPETVGLVDLATRAVFAADAFGATLSAPVEDARDLGSDELRAGAITWTTIDNPWIHTTEEAALAGRVKALAELHPSRILGAHLPPAPGDMIDALGEGLMAARAAAPFAGPDQTDLVAMIASQAA